MEKKVTKVFGKKQYLLGASRDGVYHYLEESEWDCNWYWGIGCIESFTNNRCPHLSKDIKEHTHWDSIFRDATPTPEEFREVFVETPLSDKEIWKLSEYMRELYTARHYSDMLHVGGAHITESDVKTIIKNDDEYHRINTMVIPAILGKLYALLSPSEVA